MARNITMTMTQVKNDERTHYVHINPNTGKTDRWGLVIDETPKFGEGGEE